MSDAREGPFARLRSALRLLYEGNSRTAVRFRYGLLAFDLLVVAFFVGTTLVTYRPWFTLLDWIIAAPISLDFLARLLVAPSVRRYLRDPVTLADMLVIGTLLVPVFADDLSFLRILRALRAFRSFRVQRELRKDFRTFKRNEELIEAVVNLVMFIFIVTALVFVFQHQHNPHIKNYVDALYFTVATLTTTGFGDITMQGTGGRLLAIVIMVVGVGLFLRLIRAIFRPDKVSYRCPTCGLARHDPDAVHCKDCGGPLNIPKEEA